LSSWAVNCHLGQLFPWAKEKHCWKNSCGVRNSGRALLRGRRNQPRDRDNPRRLKKRLQLTFENIWPDFQYLQEQDFYVGVQTKRVVPTTAAAFTPSLKANRYASTQAVVVAEMQQLYNQGIRNFTDASSARKFINDAVELLAHPRCRDERHPLKLTSGQTT